MESGAGLPGAWARVWVIGRTVTEPDAPAGIPLARCRRVGCSHPVPIYHIQNQMEGHWQNVLRALEPRGPGIRGGKLG